MSFARFEAGARQDIDYIRVGRVPPSWEVSQADGWPLVAALRGGTATTVQLAEAFEASAFNAWDEDSDDLDLRPFIQECLTRVRRWL